MAETDRSSVLAAFHAKKQSLWDPSKAPDPSRGPTTKAAPETSSATSATSEKAENSSRDDQAEQETPAPPQLDLNILATTDACLPTAALGESPLLTKLMINYELPAKKASSLRVDNVSTAVSRKVYLALGLRVACGLCCLVLNSFASPWPSTSTLAVRLGLDPGVLKFEV
jgi:hypothetical protein